MAAPEQVKSLPRVLAWSIGLAPLGLCSQGHMASASLLGTVVRPASSPEPLWLSRGVALTHPLGATRPRLPQQSKLPCGFPRKHSGSWMCCVRLPRGLVPGKVQESSQAGSVRTQARGFWLRTRQGLSFWPASPEASRARPGRGWAWCPVPCVLKEGAHLEKILGVPLLSTQLLPWC